MSRFWKKYPLLSLSYHTLFTYPSPSNLNYFWNFGFLSLFCLVFQIITGIFLAMHYVPHESLAFYSVEHIMRDVNNGWILRYVHSNGASAFFFVVYLHIFRGLFYHSYVAPRQWLWCFGVIILLLMILTAFLGYVLPWGQMSFWAATVITNLASAIPWDIGHEIVKWLWGGFSVSNATLNRFFSLHYLFPFILIILSLIHIILLHENGSNNPLGIGFKSDSISFIYYFIKDFYSLFIFFFIFFFFCFFYPNYLGHSDNYIMANPLVTPTHIVPEWYFLPFYAILRSVPDKLLGVILLLAAIFVLFFLPFYIKSSIRNSLFKPLSNFFFWLFFLNCLLLGWVGGKPIETPFLEIGKITTFFYFFYFLVILPFISFLENFFLKNVKKKIGALTSKPYAFQSRPWELNSIEIFDILDSFTSKIRVDLRGTKILRINSSIFSFNFYWISDRTRFSYDSFYNQRILMPYIKLHNLSVESSWNNAFSFMTKNIFSKINSSQQFLLFLGSLVDLTSIFFVKKLYSFLGSNFFFSTTMFVRNFTDYLSNFFFSLDKLSLYSLFVIWGNTLRLENPIFNIHLKQKNIPILLFTCSSLQLDSSFLLGTNNFTHLNLIMEGKDIFSFFFFKYAHLHIILENFFEKISFSFISYFERLKYSSLKSDYFFFFSKISSLLINNLFLFSSIILNSTISKEYNFIYFLNVDNFKTYFFNKHNYFLYQGHHGDSIASLCDVILPCYTHFEQNMFFLNFLGKFKKNESILVESNFFNVLSCLSIYLYMLLFFFFFTSLFPLFLFIYFKNLKIFKVLFIISYNTFILWTNNYFFSFLTNFMSTNVWTQNSLNLTLACRIFNIKKNRFKINNYV